MGTSYAPALAGAYRGAAALQQNGACDARDRLEAGAYGSRGVSATGEKGPASAKSGSDAPYPALILLVFRRNSNHRKSQRVFHDGIEVEIVVLVRQRGLLDI